MDESAVERYPRPITVNLVSKCGHGWHMLTGGRLANWEKEE